MPATSRYFSYALQVVLFVGYKNYMKVRLVPYSEVFVDVMMTLNEAVELSAALHGTGNALYEELEAALERAIKRQNEKDINVKVQSDSNAGPRGARRGGGVNAKAGKLHSRRKART